MQALEGSIDTAHFTFAHLSFDRTRQKTKGYTGIKGESEQDAAVQNSSAGRGLPRRSDGMTFPRLDEARGLLL